MQGVSLQASRLPCCSKVLPCLLSADLGPLLLSNLALSGLLQIPWPCIVTFDSQAGDGGFPAGAGMLQEAPVKPSPTALQGMMLLDQLGAADARGQFISWQSM